MRWIQKLIGRLVARWMRACPHDGRYVTADVLEGAYSDCQVMHCKRCGAVMVVYAIGTKPFWRLPAPNWID